MREGSKLRAALSTLVFSIVVLSSAAAGWALIARSEVHAPDDVRDQVTATAGGAADPRAPIEVPPFEGAVPVLAYGPVDAGGGHGVIDPATFADHLDALDAAGFRTVTLDDVAAVVEGRDVELPPHPVLITVDGSHRSAWTTVDPLLAAHRFEAVAFVDPDVVVDHPTSAPLTWQEVEALERSDRWTIGLGVHDTLTAEDDGTPDGLRTRLTSELGRKATALGERLDDPPTAIGYVASGPFATEAGFQAGDAAGDGVDLVFTELRTETASRWWPSTGLPRITTDDVTGRELVRRIAGTSPSAPEGLDAPPDPAAPPVVVSLSWDDGRASVSRSLPIQQAHGFDATYFINSDQIGTSAYYLSRGQLDEVEASGNEIGGHTEGHVNLAKVSRARARTAICDDRTTLVGWYGPAAGRSFAYPFGANPDLEDQVEACGYAAARLTSGIQGPSGCTVCPAVESVPPVDRYAIATSGSIQADWTLAEMQTLVLQAEAAGGGWVNYVLHSISSSIDDEYAVSPENYDALLTWLEARPNVTVRTIGDVIADAAPSGAGA